MENLQIVAAANKTIVEAQYVEMKVPLYSYGCHKKINKALSHLKGIYSISVEFDEQKVTVWGICNKFDVLTTIRNKRKGACFWKQEDVTELDNLQTAAALSDSRINPPLALIKPRSLCWKSWKKLFIRSYSF